MSSAARVSRDAGAEPTANTNDPAKAFEDAFAQFRNGLEQTFTKDNMNVSAYLITKLHYYIN